MTVSRSFYLPILMNYSLHLSISTELSISNYFMFLSSRWSWTFSYAKGASCSLSILRRATSFESYSIEKSFLSIYLIRLIWFNSRSFLNCAIYACDPDASAASLSWSSWFSAVNFSTFMSALINYSFSLAF